MYLLIYSVTQRVCSSTLPVSREGELACKQICECFRGRDSPRFVCLCFSLPAWQLCFLNDVQWRRMAELGQKKCTNSSLKPSLHAEIAQKRSSVVPSWNQSCCRDSSVVKSPQVSSRTESWWISFPQYVWFQKFAFGLLIFRTQLRARTWFWRPLAPVSFGSDCQNERARNPACQAGSAAGALGGLGRLVCCFKEAASCVRNCCRCFWLANEVGVFWVGFFGGFYFFFCPW